MTGVWKQVPLASWLSAELWQVRKENQKCCIIANMKLKSRIVNSSKKPALQQELTELIFCLPSYEKSNKYCLKVLIIQGANQAWLTGLGQDAQAKEVQ